jgi:acetyl-CoA synthetase
MLGYAGEEDRNMAPLRGRYYHTGDVATRDEDGYITFIDRTDDVFKASDDRISPFELESVLIRHAAVAEAAVVPSPDAGRFAVLKALIALAPGYERFEGVARSYSASCGRIRT